MHLAKCC